jgi:hypothetical protein
MGLVFCTYHFITPADNGSKKMYCVLSSGSFDRRVAEDLHGPVVSRRGVLSGVSSQR